MKWNSENLIISLSKKKKTKQKTDFRLLPLKFHTIVQQIYFLWLLRLLSLYLYNRRKLEDFWITILLYSFAFAAYWQGKNNFSRRHHHHRHCLNIFRLKVGEKIRRVAANDFLLGHILCDFPLNSMTLYYLWLF